MYTPTNWVDNVTAANAAHLNNLETQYTEAINSFEQDVFTAFVLSGGVATKDGTNANQLDVTTCVYFALQSDSSLRRRVVNTPNYITSTPSTTYYLDFNPDGTTSWGTAHSGVANYLPIAQVTTDGSGNILVVTDARPLNTTLLTSGLGTLIVPNAIQAASYTFGAAVSGSRSALQYDNANFALDIATPQAGGNALSIQFVTWDGAVQRVPFAIGAQVFATSWISNADGYLHVKAIQSNTSFLGVKNSAGTQLAQFGAVPSHGAADMAIGGTTYWTTQASSGFNNSASFSSFDVAEVYQTDRAYEDGDVLCVQDGRMRRCIHDGCHAAMIVSKAPGFAIGDPVAISKETGETCELLALVGRMRCKTGGYIRERDMVTSDGRGGVRAMRSGEHGFALGYALDKSNGGDVGICVRPMYVA